MVNDSFAALVVFARQGCQPFHTRNASTGLAGIRNDQDEMLRWRTMIRAGLPNPLILVESTNSFSPNGKSNVSFMGFQFMTI